MVGLEGTAFLNDWDLWVFADTVESAPPADVMVTDALNDAAQEKLKAGGKVLLLAPPATVKSNVAIGFSTVFWNTAWTHNQPPHTLGILCDPKHPAFASFPAEGWSNWQWWELVTGSAAMILNDSPAELRPLVQPIDTWFEARRLGLLFEAKCGGGKLLVCSMDLAKDLDKRIVARQLRRSVLDYMAGSAFDPKVELSVERVQALFKTGGAASGKAKADSEADGYEAAKAVDGDPATLWHTVWEPQPASMPHHLIVDLGKEQPVKALVYTPRQDQANGRIAQYRTPSRPIFEPPSGGPVAANSKMRFPFNHLCWRDTPPIRACRCGGRNQPDEPPPRPMKHPFSLTAACALACLATAPAPPPHRRTRPPRSSGTPPPNALTPDLRTAQRRSGRGQLENAISFQSCTSN